MLKPIKKLLKGLIINKTLTIDNHTYRGLRFWYFGRLSMDPTESLEIFLRAIFRCTPGVVIDVGVNMGQTLIKVISIDKSRQYIGFEPDASCFLYVQKFIEANRLESHQVFPIALSNRFGVSKMLVREGSTLSGSLVKGFRPDSFYSYSKSIYTAPGDDMLSNLELSSISVMKVDVEGAELEVLEGMRKSINTYKPFILFEVLPNYMKITNEHLDAKTVEFRVERTSKLEKILKEESYSIFQIQPGDVLQKVDKLDPGQETDLSKSNYLAIPNIKENEFFTIWQEYGTVKKS